MKVMLLQLPHFYDGTSRPPTLYPLGLGYLANALRPAHEPAAMDLWAAGASVDDAMRAIGRAVPDVFCISVYSTQYRYFRELAAAIRAAYPSKKIVAGGPGATFSYRILLEKTDVDFCVVGEGEETLVELLACIDEPGRVAGIAYRREGEVVVAPPRTPIESLDALPFPDRELFDQERYIENCRRAEGQLRGLRAANVIAGRGCPYRCTFCSKTFGGCRLRSVARIGDEIRHLKSRWGVEAVEFNDELVLINRTRSLELCASLKEIDIRWGCQGRINQVDEEILRAMKDARCMYVGYGVESWTQAILDRMKKGIDVEKVLPVIEMTRRVGLAPVIQYMAAFPGEDAHSMERTFEFFTRIDHPYVGSVTTPLPGSELYDECIGKGLIPDEERYLSELEAGYTVAEPRINLTDLPAGELSARLRDLQKRIDDAYYRRHPVEGLLRFLEKLARALRLLATQPAEFARKVKRAIGRRG